MTEGTTTEREAIVRWLLNEANERGKKTEVTIGKLLSPKAVQKLQVVEHYAAKRDNRKMAKKAIGKWNNA